MTIFVSNKAEQYAQPHLNLRDKRILIVTEDRADSELLVRSSEAWQMIPYLAGSGAAAIRALEVHPEFDLILFDYQLSFMNGLQMLKILKQQHETLPPLVMLTCMKDRNVWVRALELGVSRFVYLPIQETQLTEVLQQTVTSAK